MVHIPSNSSIEPFELCSFRTKNLTMILMIKKKCCPNVPGGACFSVVDCLEKPAATDFVGDITHQQPVTMRVMPHVLMLQLTLVFI